MAILNFDGVIPACVTPFDEAGEIDVKALAAHGRWLASVKGVTGIVCNGHAGEGLAMTEPERLEVIHCLVDAVGTRMPIIAGVVGEGTRVAAAEAKRAAEAGASGLLVYPAHGWLRFGYQHGAPEDRYRAIEDACAVPLVLFLYPDVTKATYSLETQLSICANPRVVAIKQGVRNMARWDTEVPVIRRERPRVKIVTCQDEYLLHTMWESDGALVGYGAPCPELMVELLTAAKTHDYAAAKKVYDRTLKLTSALYHIEPHAAVTVALKTALVLRGLLPSGTVRSPLMPLSGPQVEKIREGLLAAGISLPRAKAATGHRAAAEASHSA
jgi:4-hydroxy-tetrahydrodipicolinate synthase